MFQVPPPPMPQAGGVPRPAPPPAYPGAPGAPFFPTPPVGVQFPWLSMPLPLPPMPVPNLAEMSAEDLTRLEGDHRRALELRVTHLRNIQALLDAAVIQFTQYISLIPATPMPNTSPGVSSGVPTANSPVSEPTSSTPSDNASTAPVVDSVNSQDAAPVTGQASLSNAGETNESEEVRRRRLNRFVQA